MDGEWSAERGLAGEASVELGGRVAIAAGLRMGDWQGELEFGWGAGGVYGGGSAIEIEVGKDSARGVGLGDGGDEAAVAVTVGAGEDIDGVDAKQEVSPGGA